MLDREMISQLKRLKGQDGAPLFPVLVEHFIKTGAEYIQQIKLNAADAPKGLAAAHTLKGCSYNMGARSFGLMCGQIEEALRAGNVERVSLIADQLEKIFPEVISELQKAAGPR